MPPTAFLFTVLSFTACLFSVTAPAYGQTEASTREAVKRQALLKEFVAQDHGDITTLEPSTTRNGGVFVGYASGAVWACNSNQSCTEFGGTPNTPVTQIAASPTGNNEIVWVAYRQGALYRCEKSLCLKSVPGATN